MLGGSPLRVLPSKTAIMPVSKDLMPRSHDEVGPTAGLMSQIWAGLMQPFSQRSTQGWQGSVAPQPGVGPQPGKWGSKSVLAVS